MSEQQTFLPVEAGGGAPATSESPLPENLHYMSRRGFAKAAFIGGCLVQGEAVRSSLDFMAQTESKIWPSSHPTLTFLEGAEYTNQTEAAIYLPGFNDALGPVDAQKWQRSNSLPPGIPIGYIDYSTEGASIKDIARLIREQIAIKNLQSLRFFGKSMGGLYAPAVAAELGVPVQSLELCSSPSTFDNTDFGKLSGVVAKVPANRTFATIAKFFAGTYRSHRQHPEYSLSEICDDAFTQTVNGTDPVALQKENAVARSIHILNKTEVDHLRKVFIPGFSQVAYAASKHPDKDGSDGVVYVIASGLDYKHLFNDELGVTFKLFGINYIGHANVGKTTAVTALWSRSVASQNATIL